MIKSLSTPPAYSLLHDELLTRTIHHQDTFVMLVEHKALADLMASDVLEKLLQAFISNPPEEVGRLMAIRNFLVRPMGLRTSKLGCPVSSLASADKSQLFNGAFPVLNQQVNLDGALAQVTLGANDKHLLFRSCVGVERVGNQQYILSLGTKVHCTNWFGRFYMQAIDRVHRKYVSPLMLEQAANTLIGGLDYTCQLKD